jgi:hypothetical protein
MTGCRVVASSSSSKSSVVGLRVAVAWAAAPVEAEDAAVPPPELDATVGLTGIS